MWIERTNDWLRVRTSSGLSKTVNRNVYSRSVSKILVISLFAFWFSHLAPSTAEQEPAPLATSTPSQEPAPLATSTPSQEPTPLASSTPSQEPTPLASSTPSQEPTTAPSGEPLSSPSPVSSQSAPSPTPSPTPIWSTSQNLSIHIPSTVQVDPRAYSVFLPPFYFEGSQYIQTCINGSNLSFDIGQKGEVNTSLSAQIGVAGDLTSNLVVTGTPKMVAELLGSGSGLKAFSQEKLLDGGVVKVSTVVLLKPSLDPSYCRRATLQNINFLQLKSFGLTLRLMKGTLKLH